MPCYKPLKGYHAPGGRIVFDSSKSFGFASIDIACGRCIGCRLEKAKEWALRCHHESQMHSANSFITLTYDQAHLPEGGTLVKSDFQKFIRALRKAEKKKIRYYMCGEYGDENLRPHYHAILFGFEFVDAYFWRLQRGNRIYRSATLEKFWPYGNSEIGAVTFKSAGYVARYILKKQNGTFAERAYSIVDAETGEIVGKRLPPYTQMSLKPGIGKSWYDKHKTDLFPHDYAVLPDGRQTEVPAYYRELLARENPDLAEALRKKRIAKALDNPDNSPERLAVREFVKTKKAERLVRPL